MIIRLLQSKSICIFFSITTCKSISLSIECRRRLIAWLVKFIKNEPAVFWPVGVLQISLDKKIPGKRDAKASIFFFFFFFFSFFIYLFFFYLKRTSVKSSKNDIFMVRVKNSNCLNFCTQVDPSKTRKAVYFFPSNVLLFSIKTNFSLSPSGIDGSGHNRSKIEHFRSLRISKILRLGKSYQRVLFHRLFVFCKM